MKPVKHITIAVSEPMLEAIKLRARLDHRSMAKWIIVVMEAELDKGGLAWRERQGPLALTP
jgi:hypothetical protein